MRRVLGWVLAALLVTGVAQAQTPPAGNTLVHATAEAVKLTAGGNATATVHVTVLAGWHTYSNPPSLEYNIPTKVVVAPAFGVSAGKPKYPAGRQEKVAGDDQPMSVYDGTFDVTLPLAAATSAENGAHVLKGKVEYQACNDQMCLAPTSVPFTIAIDVSGGAATGAAPTATTAAPESASASHDTVASAPAGEGFMTAPPPGTKANETAEGRRAREALATGLLGWLLLMVVTGLGLNLTPCVFPMLSITVSIFGARKTETTPKAVLNAFVYVLGIGTMYTVLGVVAGMTGGFFGAALSNPWVLAGLGAFLLVLSLSMFGFYELQAPTWLLDKVGGANTGSLAGLYVSGLVVGVIAAPCIGPFVLAVLGVITQRASAVFGLQTMLAMSIGLGAPYLVLATFSNLLGRMPRAGEWMEWIKKLFGIVLATLGLNYILLGLAPKIAPWLLPAALLLGGLYIGFMEKSGNSAKRFKAFKNVLGAVAVVLGAWLVLQITAAKSRTLEFKPWSEQAVAASLSAGRGVIVDFSADWCVPCHEMELQVFPDAGVRAAAKGFDAYRVDMTRGNSPAADQYGVKGVPTILLMGPDGRERADLRVTGKIDAAEFVRRLAAVGVGSGR